MDSFVRLISNKHRIKLATLARNSGVNSETAMRNIINHLKTDHGDLGFGIRQSLKQFVTVHQVEGFIDTLAH